MRKRLVLSYLGLVFMILLLLEVPLGILANRYERSAVTAQAEAEATSFASLADDALQFGQAQQLDQLVRGYRAGGNLLIVPTSGPLQSSADGDQSAEYKAVKPMLPAVLGGRVKTAWKTVDSTETVVAAVPLRLSQSNPKVVGTVAMFQPANTMVDRVRVVWLGLTFFAIAVLIFTVVVGRTLARGITKPIDGLADAVKRLGAGNLSERAAPAGPPELRGLAGEFNRMAGRIEELVNAQSRFVADASHQLRSPLTALRLRLENLEATEESEPNASNGSASNGSAGSKGSGGPVAAAGREVQRLSRLVDGLLTLSRAERANPEVHPVDINLVIAERLEAWEPLATEREVHLTANPLEPVTSGRSRVSGKARGPSSTLSLVPGDLEQILDNLIGNAVEATSPGGRVAIEAVSTRTGVDVSVADDGPGMSQEERERAFDRFWQGAGHRGGSSGLGLAIVAQLAQRNHAGVDLLDARPRHHEADRPAGVSGPTSEGGSAGPTGYTEQPEGAMGAAARAASVALAKLAGRRRSSTPEQSEGTEEYGAVAVGVDADKSPSHHMGNGAGGGGETARPNSGPGLRAVIHLPR